LSATTLGQFLAEAIVDKRRARVMLGLIVASDEDRRLKDELRRMIQGLRAHLAAILERLGVDADLPTLATWHALLVGAAVLHVARDDAASAREAQAQARFVASSIARTPQASARVPRKR
jgi:hypothetical protein